MAIVTSQSEKAAFTPDKFNPVRIGATDRAKVLLTCFQPGQFIPVHRPGVDLTFVVMSGEGVVVADNQEAPLSPGVIAFISAGEARGIKATTELVIFNVVTPPPGDEDHSEMTAKLKEQTWR